MASAAFKHARTKRTVLSASWPGRQVTGVFGSRPSSSHGAHNFPKHSSSRTAGCHRQYGSRCNTFRATTKNSRIASLGKLVTADPGSQLQDEYPSAARAINQDESLRRQPRWWEHKQAGGNHACPSPTRPIYCGCEHAEVVVVVVKVAMQPALVSSPLISAILVAMDLDDGELELERGHQPARALFADALL